MMNENSEAKKKKRRIRNKIPIFCKFCNRKVKNKYRLYMHIKTIHDKIRDFKCDVCGFSSSKQDTLKLHVKIKHERSYDVLCEYDQCSYKCNSKGDLYIHIRYVHKNIKNFKCDECKYLTTTRTKLNLHLKARHYKIKDQKCKYCKYSATQKTHLDRHMKAIHFNIREIKCPDCDFATTTRNHLQYHKNRAHNPHRIFGSEQYFECMSCSYISSRKKDTINHVKIAHEKKNLLFCEYCDVIAYDLDDFNAHIRIDHEIGENTELHEKVEIEKPTYNIFGQKDDSDVLKRPAIAKVDVATRKVHQSPIKKSLETAVCLVKKNTAKRSGETTTKLDNEIKNSGEKSMDIDSALNSPKLGELMEKSVLANQTDDNPNLCNETRKNASKEYEGDTQTLGSGDVKEETVSVQKVIIATNESKRHKDITYSNKQKIYTENEVISRCSKELDINIKWKILQMEANEGSTDEYQRVSDETNVVEKAKIRTDETISASEDMHIKHQVAMKKYLDILESLKHFKNTN